MKLLTKRKNRIILILDVILLLAMCACFLGISRLSSLLLSQQEAQRWQGDNELAFSQVSCFLPVDSKLVQNEVYSFRSSMMDAFHAASLESDNLLFTDCWCAFGKAAVSGVHGSGTASVTAVGGKYFDFHPLELLSGTYFSEDNFSPDLVILDEELAWLLFGSSDVAGMSINVEGREFTVSGVIAREDDFASKLAYTSGMGLFMSYEAYSALFEEGISTYEVVMPQPVKGFAMSTVEEKFPLNGGLAVENTGRFGYERLFRMLTGFGKRSMQTEGVLLPYWENAARCIEDWCALLLFAEILFSLLPLATLIVAVARSIRYARNELEDDWWPAFKEKAAETIRKRQRRGWEKRHKKV